MRKKPVLLIAALVSFVMTGCKDEIKSDKPVRISDKFEKQADISFYGREYKADVRRGSGDIWEIVFTAPESIAGLTVTASSDGYRISYDELEYLADTGAMPCTGLVPMLTDALEKTIEGEEYELSGERFEVMTEGDEIKEISVPGKLKAVFGK